jgi:transcriptional regulator with XRE-family HTH domain
MVGRWLRVLRQTAGMSQYELAKKSRISQQALRHYEAGLATLTANTPKGKERAARLAAALGVSAEELMLWGRGAAAANPMIKVTEDDIGRAVIYRPRGLPGIIVAFTKSFVFVRYVGEQFSMATQYRDLEYKNG